MPRESTRGMGSFFDPRSVAVAGASPDPDKLGSIIFANLLANRRKGLLKAKVYALNPSHRRIGEEPCYPSVRALPEIPELLIVSIPAPLTLDLLRSAADAGVKAAILISGGYAEVGRIAEEQEIGRLARESGMRVLGPNTIGLVDTRSGVDSLFLRSTKTLPDGSEVVSSLKPIPGDIVVITQSGYLGEAVSAELAASGVGVRAIVGTGNQLDVSVEDVVQYFAADPHTRVMAIYLEGVKDGRRFMRAAASAAKKKPLVAFKVGKTERGARAALTHTSSMVGDYDAYRAAFRQSGVLEAETLQELIDYSVALRMLPKAEAKRIAIMTNAGGVGAIAADEAVKLGLQVNPMRAEAERRLRAKFRGAGFMSNASLGNPVDLTASVTSEEFAEVMEFVLGLPQYDGAVVLPTHQAPGMRYDVGERLGDVAVKSGKPVTMSVIGLDDLAKRVHRAVAERGIPGFPTPERAVKALAAVSRQYELRRASGAPSPVEEGGPGRFTGTRQMDPQERSRLLRVCGLDEPKSVVVRSADDRRLDRLNFPVACKLLSPALAHKSDVGGVVLGVESTREARAAFKKFSRLAEKKGLGFEGMLVQEMVKGGVELLLGGTRDETFGPMVTLGFGGTMAELVRDYRLAVAPVSPRWVRAMISDSKMGQVLGGYRGGPKVDVQRLSQVVSKFSRVLSEAPEIREMEVNPLVAAEDGLWAVDVRAAVSARPY